MEKVKPMPLTAYKEFKSIINEEKINTLFQPIVSLKTGEALGYEALSRGARGKSVSSAGSFV